MIHIVVPAFNEEAHIGRLIQETDAFLSARNLGYRLFVVDDGSKDRTGLIVEDYSKRYPCEVIGYNTNKGVGEAFRFGFNHVLGLAKSGDWIMTQEADGTSDLEILPKLLSKAQGGCDVVLASCYAPGGGIEGTTAHRMMLSRAANFLITALFPLKHVHTYSSFYRVYHPEILRKVHKAYGDYFDEPGFACVVELLVRMAKLGAKIEEVPMILRGARRAGKSKMKIGRTIAGYFRVIGNNAFRRPAK